MIMEISTAWVLVFRDFTEKKEKQDRIVYLSFYDQLTGVYNRRYFEEELNRLDTERNYPLTLVMFDVNGLKLVNDAFGHLVGDGKGFPKGLKGKEIPLEARIVAVANFYDAITDYRPYRKPISDWLD